MDDLVSIVMPAHNLETYVADSIRTVLAQTHRDWELVFVDDASTDRTPEIAAAFRDPRIRILRNERNLGAALSRNRAIREARGRWVAFLDADDWWHPEKLERQLAFMRERDCAFSCTDYRTRLDGVWQDVVWTGPAVADRRVLYRYDWFSTITVMWDLDRIGRIQIADLRRRNDYLLWLHAVEKAPCLRLPECLAFYIRHDGSLSRVGKWRLVRWQYQIYRKGLDLPRAISAFCCARNIFFGSLKRIVCRRPVTPEVARLSAEAEQAAQLIVSTRGLPMPSGPQWETAP